MSARLALIIACGLIVSAPAISLATLTKSGEDRAALEARIGEKRDELGALSSRERAQEARLRETVGALYRMTRGPSDRFEAGIEGALKRYAEGTRLERIIRAELDGLSALRQEREILAASIVEDQRLLAEELERAASVEARRRELEAQARIFASDLPALPVAPLIGQGGTISVHGDPLSTLGFASLRGNLGAPVRGVFRVRDAVRDGGPGLEFLVPEGTPIVSVADGRIAYTDRLRDFGRLVIVDHGQSYFTVYAGLSRIDAETGAFVAKGQVLGAADEAGLFFEVREGARSLDPRHWTGL